MILLNDACLESIKLIEGKYHEYNLRIYIDDLPAFEECRFLMMFVANDIHWNLTHSCICYRGEIDTSEIDTSEIDKMIELIESKINSKIEVKKVEVKAEDYKPVKCPCCGGTLNSISFCGNDTYIKCEYCDTILTR